MQELKKRVLVTGGAGFIGAQIVRQLLQHGHTVSMIARPESSLERLSDCLDRLEVRRVDLGDSQTVRQIVLDARPECAIHAAWYAVPGKYWTAPENLDCVMFSLSLAKSLASAGCRRVVSIGSCFEYDYDYGYLSESLTPLNPRTLYAIAKNATHSVLEGYCRVAGISFTWARTFYVYGPGEQESRLVPSVILALLRGETAKCTKGLQVRDYLSVEDVASAIVAVAQSEVEGTVNIGSGEPVTVRTIVQTIGEVMDQSHLIAFGAVKSNPVDPPFLLADVRRLRNEVGWRPSIDLNEGIVHTVQWWRERTAIGSLNR
jgi:UDP-glucuronate decarboxylase